MKRDRLLLTVLFVAAFVSEAHAQQAPAGGVKQAAVVPGAGRETFCAAFSPDARFVAAGGQGLTAGEVKIFSVPAGEEILAIKYNDAPAAIAFSPDGARLAAAVIDGQGCKLHVWDLAAGKETYVLEAVSGAGGWSFSADGKRIASANADLTITIWDATSGDEVLSFAPDELRSPIGPLRYHSTGKYLIGAENDSNLVRVWQTADGKEIKRFDAGGKIRDIEIVKGGKQIAVQAFGAPLRVFGLSDGRPVAEAAWRVDGSSNLAISPDGTMLALRGLPANRDKSGPIKVWNAANGKELFEINDKSPTALVFSPDSARLAGVVGREGVVIWQVAPADACFQGRSSIAPHAGAGNGVARQEAAGVAGTSSAAGRRLARLGSRDHGTRPVARSHEAGLGERRRRSVALGFEDR
jgi:WD40 repeat protein